MPANDNNDDNNTAAADAAFALLLQERQPRRTTLALGLAAENQATNPWNGRSRSARYFELLEIRRGLPASATREEFLRKFQDNQVMIVIGETGSGKTTQTPQHILYDELPGLNGKLIACTQPRRVAASECAARVAQELDVTLGEEVGFAFKGERRKGPRTRLIYVTDGHLFEQMTSDPTLSAYSCIVIDEAHERTEATDLLLGGLKKIMEARGDLKVIIMSATLRAATFENFFPGAAIHNIPGRTFGVDVACIDDTFSTMADYIVAATRAVRHILVTHRGEGDILVFLPGEDDIAKVIAGIRHMFPVEVVCLPLHAKLPESLKQLALRPDPRGRRKCIVATNIAETSLTVDGVVFVVDTGLQKVKTWNPRIRMSALKVTPASKAAIQQRRGRAGRTRPGVVYELFSKEVFNTVALDDALPAMLSNELSRTVLQVLSMNRHAKVDDLWSFPWLSRPSVESVLQAFGDLYFLGCLDSHGQVTSLGRLAMKLPLEPRRAVAVIKASQTKPAVVWEIAAVLSMMEEGDMWQRPDVHRSYADIIRASFSDATGDHMAWLHVFRAYNDKANALSTLTQDKHGRQLEHWCDQHAINPRAIKAASETFNSIGRILHQADGSLSLSSIPADRFKARGDEISAFFRKMLLQSSFLQVAVHEEGDTYRTLAENQPGLIHPSSALAGLGSDFVIYDEFADLSSKPYFYGVTGIEPQWLFEVAPASAYMEELLADPGRKNFFTVKRLELVREAFKRNISTA